MIDVDHFKSVNDEFGHATGDLALRAIADVLRGGTRAFDSLARYGGEEFVVVMPGSALDEAVQAAERLRSAVESTPVPMGTREELPVDRECRGGLQRTASDHARGAAPRGRCRALLGQAGRTQQDRGRRPGTARRLAQPT